MHAVNRDEPWKHALWTKIQKDKFMILYTVVKHMESRVVAARGWGRGDEELLFTD